MMTDTPRTAFDKNIMVEQLYEAYKDKLYHYFLGKCSDPQTSEDLLSEVFVKIVNAIDSYDAQKGAYSTWVFAIAHNTLVNHYRANKIKIQSLDDQNDKIRPLELVDENLLPEDCLMIEDDKRRLASLLLQLSERERDIIVGRFYQGYSPRELSCLMGLSYENVKVIQTRAVKKLRALLLT